MSETAKTFAYVGAAILALILAWEPWRTPLPDERPEEIGQDLFAGFKQPQAAQSLEIVKYNEETGELRPFRVAKVDGVWAIPSHNNYPADANEHMGQAATSVIGLKILGVASDAAGDQELYGVVEPDLKELNDRPGIQGIGTRVTFRDGAKKTLADLIIGKTVKDRPDLRYVRKAGRDRIYRVALNVDQFSTRFRDWIEKDLLKLNAWDVASIQLNDYSIDERIGPDGVQRSRRARSQVKLVYDDAKNEWVAEELKGFDDEGNIVDEPLAKDQELNKEKLNALKEALDQLQIIDVERKPEGISRDLRAGEDFVKDQEAFRSLTARGFFPAAGRTPDELEIYSSEGEAICELKDGVRYVLRFGRLAGKDEEADKEDEKKVDDNGEDDSTTGQRRYLFVSAEFDRDSIPKPELKPVPGDTTQPAADGDEDGKADDVKPNANSAPTDEAASPSKPAAAKPPAKTTPDKKSPDKKSPDKKMSDKKPEDDAADAEAPVDVKSEDAKPSDAGKTPDELRAAAEKENQRLQDEYDSKIKKGEDHVKELNDRFADWYYVISDDVYQKIHLGRKDIVKQKEAPGKEGAAEDAFPKFPPNALPRQVPRSAVPAK